MIFRRRRKNNPASKLKHQLVLQERNNTPDGMGGSTRGWSDVATLWAEITPISGRENFGYQQTTNRQRYRIMLRYRNDIKPHMRLNDVAGERVFDIQSIINKYETNEMIEILADVDFPSV